MLAELITLTPGHRNELIDCQRSKVRITILPIMHVETLCNSTLELPERGYWLDVWTIVNYFLEALRPFRYWTLWMSKGHTVTLHHLITVYNVMVDHMDDIMRALTKDRTQWKEGLFFAVKLARQKLCEYYAVVTPMTLMVLISAQILNSFRKLQLFWK